MMLSTGPVLIAAILLSHIVAAQDNSFWRFIDLIRFSINTRRPVIPTKPSLEFKPKVPTATRRVVFGDPVDVGAYPFMVFIKMDDSICGGTLLSNNWVLTAAHCLDGGNVTKILIGVRTIDGEDPNAETRTMQRKCSHKDFNPETFVNDISLIKLSSPVKYGTYIKKAKLPPANSEAPVGSTGIAMGWGLNEHNHAVAELQSGEVEVVNKAKCVAWYSKENSEIPDHHFCAGLGGADTCRGDSGGPLVIEENGLFVLRGITSFGPKDNLCGQAERPGVYTRVSSYIDWINKKMYRSCREYTWGLWLPTCSVTCGTGTETRTRECRDEDGVATSATNCPGLPTKTSTCTRPSCKQYRWGAWEKTCFVTCGTGLEQRKRNCLDELDTTVFTSFCSPGQSEEIRACYLQSCSIYRWSAWTTTCSVTCGLGTETKRRQCLDQNGQNAPARFCSLGDDVEIGSCTKATCDVYGWGPWKDSCSVTCGTGVQARTKQCLDQNRNPVSEALCGPGTSTEHGTCHKPPCKTYSWSPWTTTCSVTCGSGTETKRRQCVDQNEKTTAASLCSPGADVEYGYCMKPPCNVYAWGPWKETCSVTCGNGVMPRKRECLDLNGKRATETLCGPGKSSEQGLCYKPTCKVLQSYHWGRRRKQCSVTCGDGMELNFRQCLDTNGLVVASTLCSPGNEVERRKCSQLPCSTGHEWGPWMVTCSVSCGRGSEIKTRQCFNDKRKSVTVRNCKGSSLETGNCDKPPCPIYERGPWKDSCSVTCGNGFQTRTRQCLDQNRTPVSEALCGSGTSTEHGTCHKPPCKTYRWIPLTTLCSVTCGSGTETKRRQCVDQNGKTTAASLCSPGGAVEYGTCMKAPCTVYRWRPWKETCSVTCGSGVKTRKRECLDQNGKPVTETLCGPGKSSEQGLCYKLLCKVLQSYHWRLWRKQCSVTCGDGMELNFRQCLDNNGFGVASTHCSPGKEVERGKCSLAPCSTGHKWGPWMVTCSVSCGRGSEIKTRQCFNHKRESVTLRNCKGSSSEIGNCDKPACPTSYVHDWAANGPSTLPSVHWWRLEEFYERGPWKDSCSVTCGTGVQTRTRQCLDQNRNPVFEALCGPGTSTEHGTCHKRPCRTSSWGPWTTSCNVACGSGTETKRRQCVDQNGKTAAASLCSPGGDVEYGSCMRAPCNVLQRYHWGPWRKQCSVTCGDGMELNFRQCLDNYGLGVASTNCIPGNQGERKLCSLPPCRTGYKWGPWKVTCSVSCGHGSEVKTRQCFNHKRKFVTVRNCKGSSLETGNCNKPPCPSDSAFQWGPWKTWSRCRISIFTANRCAGFQSTTRDCLHMGRDVDPYRCISTMGGDYYRKASCTVYGC